MPFLVLNCDGLHPTNRNSIDPQDIKHIKNFYFPINQAWTRQFELPGNTTIQADASTVKYEIRAW